jgi:hypothetical protein
MKRIVLIAVVGVLLISTVGAATASATQIGHSPLYYFDVKNTAGMVVGRVVVNTAPQKPTYVFVGWGLKSTAQYTLRYTTTSGSRSITLTLGSATTAKDGVLVMHGVAAFAPHDMKTAQFVVAERLPGEGDVYDLQLTLTSVTFTGGIQTITITLMESYDGGATFTPCSGVCEMRLFNYTQSIARVGVPLDSNGVGSLSLPYSPGGLEFLYVIYDGVTSGTLTINTSPS